MCPNCGGPLAAPTEGGPVRCTYCTVTVVTAGQPPWRPTQPLLPDPTTPAERARLAHLREAAALVSSERYSMDHQPEEFADVDGFDCSRETGQRLESALQAALATRGSQPERTLWWIGERLVNLWRMRDDHVRATAVAQTVSETLEDPRYQQSMFCDLAIHARRNGDLDGAETWLAQCDAAPTELALDNDYRIAVGMLALTRELWAEAIAAVGAVSSARPWLSQSAPMAYLIRAAAHEQLGHQITADEDLREAIDYLAQVMFDANAELTKENESAVRAMSREHAIMWIANTLADSKALAPCHEIWKRLVKDRVVPKLAKAAKQFRNAHRD